MARVAFKQCDVERALRAARAAGFEHPAVDIWPDGRMRILTEKTEATKGPLSPYEAWKQSRGERGA